MTNLIVNFFLKSSLTKWLFLNYVEKEKSSYIEIIIIIIVVVEKNINNDGFLFLNIRLEYKYRYFVTPSLLIFVVITQHSELFEKVTQSADNLAKSTSSQDNNGIKRRRNIQHWRPIKMSSSKLGSSTNNVEVVRRRSTRRSKKTKYE